MSASSTRQWSINASFAGMFKKSQEEQQQEEVETIKDQQPNVEAAPPVTVPSTVSWLASLGKKPAAAAAVEEEEAESVMTGDEAKAPKKKYRFLLPSMDRRKIPKARPFYRRGTDEEIRREWLSTRKALTEGWKRKRRDALRRVKRWQQSTGQFRAAEQLYFDEQQH
ncbi:hypothetical protein FOZ63_032013 [Perkinsus olseni]|uniref:Uncharacterized protein n=1 Tax=Perkinsus olseni TaxID=32597 RepID=A0A7J6P011_PEROL|nr:hypothetical protein FOZ63_032013 [Perkinsus olseni]